MSFQTRQYHEVVYHTSSVLENKQIFHGFSTRLGGVSGGRFASLNFRASGPERPGELPPVLRRAGRGPGGPGAFQAGP